MKTTYCAVLLAGACAATLLGSGAALAADAPTPPQADDQGGGQVVVTAERRQETLREVPLAVQAIQPSQIQKLGATSVTDLLKVIPGASLVASFGPGFDTVEIRGIAAGQFGDGLVGYYVDDTAFGIPNIQVAPPGGLLDLNRVEVIRGASGTLYGQGSMGGTIKLVTNQPNTQSFSGQAFAESSYTAGGSADYDVGGVVNMPIVKDQLAVRIAGEYDYLSGYASVPDQHLQHANDEASANVRVTALWTPSSTVSISGLYWYVRDAQNFSSFLTTVNPPTISGAGGVHGLVDVNMDIYSATLHWQSPIGDVMLNSSYFDHSIDLVFPFSTPLFGFEFPSIVDDAFKTHQFTQEARVTSQDAGPIRWMAGAFYRDATINSDLLENLDLTGIGFGNDALINATGPLHAQDWAVYGEASAPLFDGKLTPLIGLREESDSRSFLATEYATFPRVATPAEPLAAQSWTSLDPRFNLKFTPTDNGLIYLNIAKGFRSGSIQTQDQAVAANEALALPPGTIKTIVNPDYLWTYEIGGRWALLNNMLVVEASGYHTDWSNVVLDFTLPPADILAVANVGNARIDGADFGVTWRTPIEGLSFAASGNVDNARLVTVQPTLAKESNIKPGGRLPNVPADNYTVSTTYVRQLDWMGGMTGSLYVSYAFRDKVMDPTAMANGLPAFSGELNDVDLRATLKKGNWTIDAFVLNALNDKGPATLQTIPYPLRAGVRLGVKF
jgi:outer membrane receptor protein involved in Fe transport